MPLQSEGYPEASLNLDDQLKWTKETRILEISTSTSFISRFVTWLYSYWSFLSPPPPLPRKKKKSVEFSVVNIFSNNNNQKKLISKKKLPFRLRHRVSSINVIIALFALNFSRKQFIRSKEEIDFLRFTDGCYDRNFENSSHQRFIK